MEIEHTLKKIHLIKKEYDLLRRREEKFNIFSVLHFEHDERRLHSRFIANLLDPYASHGLNHTFLNRFIQQFKELDEINYSKSTVYPQELEKKESNNIDILIIDQSSKHAIIIENKIYASDSNNGSGGQLERYFKHVNEIENIPKAQIHVFYLTLDGHEPTQESLGDFKKLSNINGKCISYKHEILNWLNDCVNVVIDQPFLRESILQYKKLLNKMTNNESNIEERIKIKAKKYRKGYFTDDKKSSEEKLWDRIYYLPTQSNSGEEGLNS